MRKVNEAQREERRTTILEAAARCFRRSGFRGASISDICRESGVGVGNLYHYFESKEAMVEAIAARDVARAGETFDTLDNEHDLVSYLLGHPEIADTDGYAIDDALSAEIAAEAARNPRIAAIRRETDLGVRRRLAGVLRNAQARGMVNRALDPDDAAWILVMLFEGFSLRRLTDTPAELERGQALLMAQVGRLLAPDPPGDSPA